MSASSQPLEDEGIARARLCGHFNRLSAVPLPVGPALHTGWVGDGKRLGGFPLRRFVREPSVEGLASGLPGALSC
jgi:hypothetical protein